MIETLRARLLEPISATLAVGGLLFAAGLLAPVALAQSGGEDQPFEVVRGRGVLARIDTRTGAVWTTASNGDGGWTALGSAPAQDGQPELVGRYQVRPLGGGGRRMAGQDGPVRLLLTDGLTGRSWMAAVVPEGRWLEIPEPDGSTPQSSAQ